MPTFRVPGIARSLRPQWLLVLLTALLIVFRAASAEAATPGVVTDMTWGISDSQKQQTAAAMQDAGVRWTRISVGWHDIEPSPGSYSSRWLADLDASVQDARSAGVNVLLDVIQAPQWASGSTNKEAPPSDPQDLAPFMRFIAERYKGQVQAYEIWNEENGTRFWPGGADPAAYTALLKVGYTAVKSTDPSALVVFGGMAQSDYNFVEGAYAAGAKGYFDVMGVHPYSCWDPDFWYWEDPKTGNWSGYSSDPKPAPDARVTQWAYTGYREVHNVMVSHGDDKPLWFTEFGWSTAGSGSCHVSEQTQADYLTRAYKIAEQDPYVQVALWYNFRADYWADATTNWDAGLGLLNQDFTPKPAYYAFKDYAATVGSPPPPTTDPPPATDPPPSTDPPPTTDPPPATDPPPVTDPPPAIDPPPATDPPPASDPPPATDQPPAPALPPAPSPDSGGTQTESPQTTPRKCTRKSAKRTSYRRAKARKARCLSARRA